MDSSKYIYQGFKGAEIIDKAVQTDSYIRYMLNRTQQMFSYEGLPETIPARMLELYMQTNGNVCIADHKGELYAFTGGLGGVPNEYYMPTEYIVSNPALQLSKSYKINQDCIVIPNDSMYMGLLPMFSRYATLLNENDITMFLASISMRMQSILSANDDRTRASAVEYLKQLYDGRLGVIAENSIFDADGLKTNPFITSQTGYLSALIEYEQYLKAGWYNELGLQANYNMKRESINSNEAQLNEDSLYPLVDDMLNQRIKGLEKVNAMFGTSITIRKSSSWEDNQIELDKAQNMESEGTQKNG